MMRAIDETKSRSDLAARRECKFVIDASEVDLARRCLRANGKPVIHHHPVSTVRSVYFDDASLSACRANLIGLADRQKLRLRWYDSLTPRRSAFLEVKWRRNRVTGKHRLRIESERDLAANDYQSLMARIGSSSPAPFDAAIIRFFEPTVIVEYQREHFVSRDGRIRITLDYGLRFYDQTGKRRLTTLFPISKPSLAVIEGKTTVGDESLLRSMLFPMKLRASRCSKYVHGCQALGLVSIRE